MLQAHAEHVRQSIEALQIVAGAGRAEREAVLFTARDLIVLIVVVAVVLWLASQIARK